MRRRQALQMMSAGVASLACPMVFAENRWPTKSITYIVPFAVGGASDILARLTARELGEVLGVTIVVENKAGAGGSIGAEQGARAKPDGYTICGGTISSHAINVSLYPKIGYDPVKSFVPIAMYGSNPLVLAVGRDSKFKDFNQVLQAVKANPGSVTSGSSGFGSSTHMVLELLKVQAGAEFTHVPYRGSGPAIPDVISGQTDMMFDPTVTLIPQVQSGTMRALAVTSTQRLPALPDVPTVAEFIPGLEMLSWQAVFAPSETPAPVVERLHAETAKILRDPNMQKRLSELGMLPADMSVQQIQAFQKAEVERWANVVKTANVHL